MTLTINTIVSTSTLEPEVIEPGSFAIGINLDGMEYGGAGAVPNVNYAIPSLSELQYYKSQGQDLIRLPISWATLQTSLNGPLVSTYLANIESVVNNAASLGMKVIVDLHNFGGYEGNQLGSAAVTDADFANLWMQLSKALAGNPGLGGYDLMNEPNNMPSATAWTSAAQAAITAIRTQDMTTPIYVEGNDYASSLNWSENNPGFASLNDPANNLIFEAHVYLDSNDSGTNFDWAQQASLGVTTETGVERLQDFTSWLQANHLKGSIGEIGVGNDNSGWITALDNTLAYAQANNLETTYWAGGPWWGSYPMSVEPTNGVSAPQMAVLDKYSGDYPTVTAANLSGTATAGSTVYLSENDVLLATTTANAAGSWSYDLTGLADGVHVIVAGNTPPTVDGTITATTFNLVSPDPPIGPTNPPCFACGTHIRTRRGEVAVEDLAIGDTVLTRCPGGPETRKVVWIGRRRVNCARHPDPQAVWPVLIRAGAFGENMPARDLRVSPGHAVHVENVLVQAEKLLNGVTVLQIPCDTVEYFHIELDSHDILLAENLPAESYLDIGNRNSFANGGTFLELYPDFRAKHWTETCVPLVLDGPEITGARAQLLARAAQEFGFTTAPENDLHVMADGRRIDAVMHSATRWVFVLLDTCQQITLNSRSFIPAHIDPGSDDTRVLGVCAGCLILDGRECALDDETLFTDGWNSLELRPDGTFHRWTSGSASLPAGTGLIVVDLVSEGFYWTECEDDAEALCVGEPGRAAAHR